MERSSLGKPIVFIVLEWRLLACRKALHLYAGTHSIGMQEPKVITKGDVIESTVMHIKYLNAALLDPTRPNSAVTRIIPNIIYY